MSGNPRYTIDYLIKCLLSTLRQNTNTQSSKQSTRSSMAKMYKTAKINQADKVEEKVKVNEIDKIVNK